MDDYIVFEFLFLVLAILFSDVVNIFSHGYDLMSIQRWPNITTTLVRCLALWVLDQCCGPPHTRAGDHSCPVLNLNVINCPFKVGSLSAREGGMVSQASQWAWPEVWLKGAFEIRTASSGHLHWPVVIPFQTQDVDPTLGQRLVFAGFSSKCKPIYHFYQIKNI